MSQLMVSELPPGFIFKTEPKSWCGCQVPTDDERLAEFKAKYYALGCHHKHEDSEVEGE